MKAIRKHLKVVAVILCIPLILQSCRVYRSTPIPLEKALSKKYVKVKDGDKKYKFKFIRVSDDKFYGYTNKTSKTSKLLSEQIVDEISEKNLVVIELKDEQLNEIYPTNHTLSIMLIISPIILSFITGAVHYGMFGFTI